MRWLRSSGWAFALSRTLAAAPWRRALVAWLALICALPALSATADPLRVVVLGDSLTAGFGLAAGQAFPARLEAALRARGHDVRIDNAGVSGDTASAGLARLDWAVPEGTAAVIVELGGNDALRGVSPALTRAALDAIVRRLKQRQIHVLLAGMRAPPNLGAEYVAAFEAIYPELARIHDVALVPFFLDGVAAEARLNLADGMHPNAEGVAVMVERMLPAVEALIARAKPRKGA
jgi:acyl-CoA thioesterase-1